VPLLLKKMNAQALHPGLLGMGEYIDGKKAWWRYTLDENLALLEAHAEGLTSAQARRRMEAFGKNVFQTRKTSGIPRKLTSKFLHPLILLLLFAGAISAATGEAVSAFIIAFMVVLSVVLDFLQEYRAEKTAERLKQSVALRATVIRDGKRQEINSQGMVPGDIVMICAGQLVPADGVVMAARDLFVKQAALTGEPYPVEKINHAPPDSDDLHQAINAVFMGSSVVSGEATILICATGRHTQIGRVAQVISSRRADTAFERGIRKFGGLILRITSVLIAFVVIVNLLAHKPLLESFLFALALAVGLTPELLPMIVTVTLSRGALRLSKRHVVVKRLSAIQDLGAIDVLCTDKTGTLTEGSIRLEQHLDIHGKSSACVLRYAWLNCYFESGVKTSLEDAVLAHESIDAAEWNKIDEVPFDFERRRLSVLLEHREQDRRRRWLILKGAPEDVIGHCTMAANAPDEAHQQEQAIDEPRLHALRNQLASLENLGYRTLAVAVKEMPLDRSHALLDDEAALTLIGFLAFLDPPKSTSEVAIRALRRYGVDVKILTGDSELVTQFICNKLNIPIHGVLMGKEIAEMDDAELHVRVESANLFCRVNPLQKNRVILALQFNGHVVGYLGDGINDAPALHNADVGISVDTAVDVAKEAADLILLRHNLSILAKGVLEGRRTFVNVRKYIMMGTSSNFGNMFSMAGAALFLPFLPMLPLQILLNNVLYDLSELTIPMDRVDQREIKAPQKWDMTFLRNFMFTMGPVSSLFDFLTFYLLFKAFHANERLFQTAWFVESLVTQVLVIFVVRTRFNPLKNRPHPTLVAMCLLIAAIAVSFPFMPWAPFFGMIPLPSGLYGVLTGLIIFYLMLAQLAKMLFYRRERKNAFKNARMPAGAHASYLPE